MVKNKQNIEYYHLWNIINLNAFIAGWFFILDSFKDPNTFNFLVGFFMVILFSISIFYQNKLERDLL